MPLKTVYFVCIFIASFLCALPGLMTWQYLNLWLTQLGFTPSFLTSLGIMGLPHYLKVFILPILEKFELNFPLKNKHWLNIFMISTIIVGIGVIIFSYKIASMNWWSFIAIGSCINFFSIIGLQSFYIIKLRLLENEDLDTAVIASQIGQKTGRLLGGAGLLYLAYYTGWSITYLFTGSIFILFSFFLMFILKMNNHLNINPLIKINNNDQKNSWSVKTIFHLLKNSPLFFLLISTVHLGDEFLSPIINIYYLHQKFNYLDIAHISKLWGTSCFIAGTLCAHQFKLLGGSYKVLLIAVSLHLISLLCLLFLICYPGNIWILTIIICFKMTTLGLKTALVGSLIAHFIKENSHQGLCYSLISTLKGSGLWISMVSGYWYEQVGWKNFFIIDGLLVVPSIAILWLLIVRSHRQNKIRIKYFYSSSDKSSISSESI